MPAFIPAQASRLHRLVSHVGASRNIWHREGRVPSRPRWLGATVARGRDPPSASKVRSGRRCGGARRSERQTAGRGRRREAALQGDGRYSDQAMQAAFADGCRVLRRMREREPREPHKPATPKLSADRIGWAGDAAAASRASLSRRDAWRRTRTRRQSFDCRAGRGLSQAHFGTAGEAAAATYAY